MSEKPNVNEVKKMIKRIKNINNKIVNKTIEEKENYFFKNHSDIMEKYPFLVSIICSGDDLNMLDYMLNHLEQIEKGNSSQLEVDKIVGERLSSEYVKPVVDNLDKDN